MTVNRGDDHLITRVDWLEYDPPIVRERGIQRKMARHSTPNELFQPPLRHEVKKSGSRYNIDWTVERCLKIVGQIQQYGSHVHSRRYRASLGAIKCTNIVV